ncbi:MAG TPA: 4a-hydroxytetrahydrobiopterin dehydratase [Verrucomicrobiales bacterium]|jgi:4a-hydroxytetrahydrobiopterin dehydratase|nr:4a-hydroxytetrahydrobiopterin dehydratase [Verrucomicrobiales bacterium]
MSDLLEPEEIKTKLKKIPEWDLDGKRLVRTMEFDGFEEAVDFVNEVAEIAEKHGHHPDIDIRYNKVILSLTTHSAGGLTEDDFTVAAVIDNAVD